MKPYLKKAFIISLLFNALLILLIVYGKRNGIITRFNNRFKKQTIIVSTEKKKDVVSNEQLKLMNNVPIPVSIDFCNNKKGKTSKILIVGNSLSYHGIAKEVGWNYISGMAATSMDKDYAHLLFKKIENTVSDKSVCIKISNFSTFERNLAAFQDTSINSLITFRPDIIIFQLGENVNIEEQNVPLLFEQKYIELINCFKKKSNPLTICTTPFFPSLLKNKIIEKVALSTNSYIVDLSHLPLLEPENYAKNEKNYSGNKLLWKADGIGMHPGDIGMENIAKQLFIIINASPLVHK